MRSFLMVSALAIAIIAPAAASAQGAPGQGGPPPGQGGPPAGGQGGPAGLANANAPQRITQETAKRIAEAAQAAAAAAGQRVAIAVLDANSDLVHFIRMDGAASRAVAASEGKARATILFGLPTGVIGESIAAGRPISATVSPTIKQGIEIWTVAGGLPIVQDGRIIGAIGVGGATGSSAQDEVLARAGVAALGAR